MDTLVLIENNVPIMAPGIYSIKVMLKVDGVREGASLQIIVLEQRMVCH